MSVKARQRFINVALIVIVGAVFGAMAWYYFSLYEVFNQENLRAFIRSFGSWALLAYGVVYIVSAPVPFMAPVLGTVGGLLFGIGWGTLYTVVIATISSLIPFALARRLGRDWVKSRLRGQKLGEIYEQINGSRAFLFIVVMRLTPVIPWEIENYVAGLTDVSVTTFALGTLIGIIPGTFAFTFLGSMVVDGSVGRFAAGLALLFVITVVVPVVAIYVHKRRRE